MTDTTITPPNPENRMQWSSPLLMLGGFVVAFILGALAYGRFMSNPQSPVTSEEPSITQASIGAYLDIDRVAAVATQIYDTENEFLSVSSLRTSYGGGLVSINQIEEIGTTKAGLEMILSRGDYTDTFFIPQEILDEKTTFYLVTPPDRVSEVDYFNLQPGYGITMTVITNLLEEQDGIEEVTVEATVN